MRSRIISAEVGAATGFGATGTPVGEALGGAVWFALLLKQIRITPMRRKRKTF
jgi:hypothetical protein